MENKDEYYMGLALLEAKRASLENEVPIGAVIVYNDKVIASSYNHKTINNIATHHAEILVINEACKKLKTWYLDECTLYTTIEPCMMCTGAILQSRIKKVVYGSKNEAFGYLSKQNLKLEIKSGVLEKECQEILSTFFQNLRLKNLGEKEKIKE